MPNSAENLAIFASTSAHPGYDQFSRECAPRQASIGCKQPSHHERRLLASPAKHPESEEIPMRSYDVVECGAPLKLFERPTPKPVGSEVLLRVLAAGVCHSDIHIWEGHYDLGGGKKLMLTERGMKLPLTMGHETVGEVVALGPEAEGVKLGDKRLVF